PEALEQACDLGFEDLGNPRKYVHVLHYDGREVSRLGLDEIGSFRDLGHLEIRLGRPRADRLLDDRRQLRIDDHAPPERFRYALDRHVVVRGPDSSRSEYVREPPGVLADEARDRADVVGDHDDPFERDAYAT